MVRITFDDGPYAFDSEEQDHIGAIAAAAEDRIRSRIPFPTDVEVSVSASADVLPTGDGAFTTSAGVIQWWVDPTRGVLSVARSHLAAALAHEAFHLTRYRRLPDEGGDLQLINVAVNEGLATVFARDLTGIEEPWSSYDPARAAAWAAELQALSDVPSEHLRRWNFQHPDGRAWITFRAGTWLVDTYCQTHQTTVSQIVHTPAVTILDANT